MLKNKSENIIYLIIWLIVLSLPVFTLQGSRYFSQTQVYMEWIRLLPFLLIFSINNSILVPKLLLNKKTVFYGISVLILVVGVTMASQYLKYIQNLVLEWQQQRPRQYPFRSQGKTFEYRIATNILISFLVVGFNNAIKLLINREKEEKLREQKDKAHLQTELSFLRNQISPHFFMNTLNNIHALIKFDADQAQKSVIQLSTLMRHLLNKSKNETATIETEFDFIKSYVNLMRIRLSEKVNITVHLDVKESDRVIPSMLFISLVENAFKYGVDYSKPSYVFISAHIKNDELYFDVKNSKAVLNTDKTKTGVGLKNLENQLVLLYGTNYSLTISDGESEYKVNLKIPLNHG